jgi:hypothetical protein
MKKLLLIVEDYTEMTKMQTFFKKIGLDVVAQGTELRLQEQLLSFFPDVVLAFGENKKVNSLSIGQKIKDYGRFNGKTVLILPQGHRPTPADLSKAKVDALLEAPVQPVRLIQVIAKFMGLDPETLVEKYQRLQSEKELKKESQSESFGVSGGKVPSSETVVVSGARASNLITTVPAFNFSLEAELTRDKVRVEKYSKFVQEIQIDKTQTSHDRSVLKLRWSELKRTWDTQLIQEIDNLKRQFVSALFRKK